MGLEARDLSDGPLMEATRIVQNDRGALQFSITLPSGRELVSEWVAEDKRREARDPWLSTIRQEMIADADAVREQARKARQAQAVAQMVTAPTPALVLPTGQPSHTTPTIPSTPLTSSSTAAGVSSGVSANPDDFIRQSLQQAQKDVTYWQQVAAGAATEWQKAQQNLEKWTALASAMGTKVVVESDQQAVQKSSGSNSGSTRGTRRGRPPGSKNKPKQPAEPVSYSPNFDERNGIS